MKSNRLVIRNARSGELDRVSLLLKDAYQQYEKIMPSWAWDYYLKDIMDVHSRLDTAELIVAVLGGKLAGTVTLFPDASSLEQEGWPAGWAGVRLLAVHPEFRRHGIGRALMEECIRRCRKRGIARIGLHTNEAMDAARRLYESMGFIRVPEFDFNPAPGIVVMAYGLQLQVPGADLKPDVE